VIGWLVLSVLLSPLVIVVLLALGPKERRVHVPL
jgi:hypothetical protein